MRDLRGWILVAAGLGTAVATRLASSYLSSEPLRTWHMSEDRLVLAAESGYLLAVGLAVLGAALIVGRSRKKRLVGRYFSEDDLSRIARRIGEIEARTSGEIRVVVRVSPSWRDRVCKASARDMAARDFYGLKMHRTRDRTGVLFFFLLSSREFYVYGDKGMHDKAGQPTWDRVTAEVSRRAGKDGLAGAVLAGLDLVEAPLSAHYPRRHDDVNELPDQVVIR